MPAPARGDLSHAGPEVLIYEDSEFHSEMPEIAADAAGRSLICWRRLLMAQLLCRLFDSDLEPLRPSQHLNPDKPAFNFPLTAASNGTDFAVGWTSFGTSPDMVFGRGIGPQGRLASPVRQLSEEGGIHPFLAGGSDGVFLGVWVGLADPFGALGIFGRRFDASLGPLGPAVLLQPVSFPSGGRPVAAVGEGERFLLVWAEATHPGSIFSRSFEALGAPSGPVIRLDQAPMRDVSEPSAAFLHGRYLVAWQSVNVISERSLIQSRMLDAMGAPLGPERRISERPTEIQRLPRVAADSLGGFVVVWDGVLPDDPGDLNILARRFDLEGGPLSPDFRVDASVEGLQSRPAIASLGSGRFGVTWQDTQFDGGYTTIKARTLATGPIPPVGAWLVSTSVPGYEFKVRITGGAAPIAGSLEPACIPETVCVSGALAGRSEVFLRVVGPRPNGRMWPTLVKFSTSEVEVWVRQESSGEVRYYRLAGARPGFDELPGLFDREGFAPAAGASSALTAFPGLTLAEPSLLAGEPAPPPAGAVFTSEHFPDFRFRARITAGEHVPELRKEAACIEETLCLSGAVPGRSELFVRIVGPRPNGRLWPTIVKLTTSTVEVWIEQLSTGETKYYRIEGAAPGKDDLTGLFDRVGFAP